MSTKPCSGKHLYIPRCNHQKCWDGYFVTNRAKFFTHRMVLAKYGAVVFERINGTKFLQHIERFIKENNVNSNKH